MGSWDNPLASSSHNTDPLNPAPRRSSFNKLGPQPPRLVILGADRQKIKTGCPSRYELS